MSQFDYVKTRREDVKPIPEERIPTVRRFMKFFTRLNVWVFKKSGGRLLNKFAGGFPICVVGMKGAKTGQWREVALIHLPVTHGGESIYLVASQGGMPFHPTWYHNIKANPEVEVTVGGSTRKMRARQLTDDEKRDAWPRLCELYPDFDQYQARTDRNIPVFICEPV